MKETHTSGLSLANAARWNIHQSACLARWRGPAHPLYFVITLPAPFFHLEPASLASFSPPVAQLPPSTFPWCPPLFVIVVVVVVVQLLSLSLVPDSLTIPRVSSRSLVRASLWLFEPPSNFQRCVGSFCASTRCGNQAFPIRSSLLFSRLPNERREKVERSATACFLISFEELGAFFLFSFFNEAERELTKCLENRLRMFIRNWEDGSKIRFALVFKPDKSLIQKLQ